MTINAVLVTLLFRKELRSVPTDQRDHDERAPRTLILLRLLFLSGVAMSAHHPPMFLGLFLVSAVAQAYRHTPDRLVLRERLLVALFLAGLVVLGGQQQWWLQPLLRQMNAQEVFFGALVLTAFTDSAALTYLGSLVEELSNGFQYALVAGAVTGGGLTIIANAPNPAVLTISRDHSKNGTVHPGRLLIAALVATMVAALAFWYL